MSSCTASISGGALTTAANATIAGVPGSAVLNIISGGRDRVQLPGGSQFTLPHGSKMSINEETGEYVLIIGFDGACITNAQILSVGASTILTVIGRASVVAASPDDVIGILEPSPAGDPVVTFL